MKKPIIILAIILIFTIISNCCYTFHFAVYENITVTEKGVKRKSDKDIYLIYGKDKDNKVIVFEITDSLLLTRFNSSDVYASIDVGKTYTFKTSGYREPILSLYPNIYKFAEVKNAEENQNQENQNIRGVSTTST